jgi:translation initiation factor 3 subunit E
VFNQIYTFDLILQESYTYKDPITEFVECLYVNFDFDGAQKKLRECESVSMNFTRKLITS